MSEAIDTEGETGNHHESGLREVAREVLDDLSPICRGTTGADDGDHRAIRMPIAGGAADIEQYRCIGYFAQECREIRIGIPDDADIWECNAEIMPERCGIENGDMGTEGGESGRAYAGQHSLRVENGLPDSLSCSEGSEQGEECLVADTWDAGESEKPGSIGKRLLIGDGIRVYFRRHTIRTSL